MWFAIYTNFSNKLVKWILINKIAQNIRNKTQKCYNKFSLYTREPCVRPLPRRKLLFSPILTGRVARFACRDERPRIDLLFALLFSASKKDTRYFLHFQILLSFVFFFFCDVEMCQKSYHDITLHWNNKIKSYRKY